MRDRRLALNALKSIIPLSDAENEQVFQRVAETIYATVYGTLAVALVQGFLGGMVFWWLGIATPFLWGVVMALLAVVPMLGAFVVWLPVAGFLALEGSWGKALFLIAWGGIVIALVDNLLYPVLVGKRLRLHTLPVFVAMLGGLVVFGASGIILGPVVLAITAALIEVWRRRTAGGRAAEGGIKDFFRRLAKRSNQHVVVPKGPFVRGEVPGRTLESSESSRLVRRTGLRVTSTLSPQAGTPSPCCRVTSVPRLPGNRLCMFPA